MVGKQHCLFSLSSFVLQVLALYLVYFIGIKQVEYMQYIDISGWVIFLQSSCNPILGLYCQCKNNYSYILQSIMIYDKGSRKASFRSLYTVGYPIRFLLLWMVTLVGDNIQRAGRKQPPKILSPTYFFSIGGTLGPNECKLLPRDTM